MNVFTSKELIDIFYKLNYAILDNINCSECKQCDNCYSCTDCNNCSYCILCKGLDNKQTGYWLLNKRVDREVWNEAKEALS